MCGKNNFYNKNFVIFQNFLVLGEIWPKNQIFGKILDCLYLWSGRVPKSKNRITGVIQSKFFAVTKEKLKKRIERGKKNIRRFWFFQKILAKNFFSKNPENFIIKIIFCPRFVLYKLFCYSKQKKVIGKKWVFQNGQNRPFGGPWAGPTGPKSQKRPVSAGIRVKSTS